MNTGNPLEPGRRLFPKVACGTPHKENRVSFGETDLPSLKLTITADDFGFSPSVNEAVFRAAEFGTLGAASLMPNMPFAGEAAAAVKQRTPYLPLGLHFTLTSGTPCAPKEEIPLLVDGNGRFRHGFGSLFQLLRDKNAAEAKCQIQREFAAQIAEADRLAKEHGVEFTRLDSHQHIHVLPGIFETLHAAAKQRGWTLRVPRERFGSVGRFLRRGLFWGATGLLKRAILNSFLPAVEGPDYFGILDTGKMDAAAWNAIFAVLNRTATEINVHPSLAPGVDEGGWCCSNADRVFHRSAWRRREFDAIVNDEFRKRLEAYSFSASAFDALIDEP